MDEIVLVVFGFIIAFILAFGIGANDVANSFGTSVGSKVLTLKQACILATIFEILGSILIGSKVSGTIRQGILRLDQFNEQTLMLGYVSALIGCCIWLIVATILNLPVSGTHSIVGACVGMGIVSVDLNVVKWMKILKIVSSWFISPVLSGSVSLVLFMIIRKYILRATSPLKAGLRFLPIIYTITICINLGGIYEAAPIDIQIPWWGKTLILLALCVIVYFLIWLLLVPFMKKEVEKTMALNMEKNKELNSANLTENRPLTDQVTYVALNFKENNENDDKPPSYEENMVKNVEVDEAEKSRLQATLEKFDKISSVQNTAYLSTISNNCDFNKRIRLISAPSHIDSDLDVNLTLRGYLHTIHTPMTMKNLTHNKDSKMNQGHSLSKLFKDPNVKVPEQKDTNDINTTKRGRFNIVPGKFHNESLDEINLVSCNESPERTNSAVVNFEAKTETCELQFKDPEKNTDKNTDEFSHSDPPEAAKIFSFLQILTAVFGAFAHGGNDVSNAIGPLIGLYLIYEHKKIVTESETPIWILFYGGVGISVGLWILGRRVIKTIGEDLTKITASSGFVIEIASAMTVLGASLLEIPVSTTHCKVGSVVFTGRVRSKESVDWSLFRNIIIAWIVTVPVTAAIAAGCQFCLIKFFL